MTNGRFEEVFRIKGVNPAYGDVIMVGIVGKSNEKSAWLVAREAWHVQNKPRNKLGVCVNRNIGNTLYRLHG